MRGCSIGIGIDSVSGGGIPLKSDLLRNYDSRVSLQMVDSVNSASADIMLPSFLAGGAKSLQGDKTRVAEKLYDGGTYTLFMRISQHTSNTGTHRLMTLGGGVTSASRGIEMVITGDRIRIYTADGTTLYNPYLTTGSLNTLTFGNGVFYILFQIDFANKLLIGKMYNSALAEVGSLSQSIATFVFNSNDNAVNFNIPATATTYAIDGFKKFSALKTLSQCLDNDYITDLQIHIPHSISCFDISGNLNHFSRTATDATYIKYVKCANYPLEKGFIYRRHFDTETATNVIPVISCKNTLGLEQAMNSEFLGYKITKDAPASVVHNMVDSKIRFTEAFFDRSNATIWNNSARAGYYDSSNTKDFHISELNQYTLYTWLNDGYRGMVYIKMKPNSVTMNQGGKSMLREGYEIENIFLYTTDHKGLENKKILTYTKDIFCAVLDGNGAVTYDAEGYVKLGQRKTTKPMIVYRIDDGYLDAYTSWKPLFDGLNIRASMNIHSSIVGTTEGEYTFMTWAQIKELISDSGWEICSSGRYDNDWGTGGVTEATVNSEILTSKQEIEAQGIICNHLVPNKYGITNIATMYYAKLHGYKTCHAGNIYGTGGHAANPQALDLFNMCALSLDLAGTYFCDKADNATEIAAVKAQIDVAKANNSLIILYFHKYSSFLGDAVTELANYAASEGIYNVTLDEVISDLKYQ